MRWYCSLTIAFVVQSPLSPELTVSSGDRHDHPPARRAVASVYSLLRFK